MAEKLVALEIEGGCDFLEERRALHTEEGCGLSEERGPLHTEEAVNGLSDDEKGRDLIAAEGGLTLAGEVKDMAAQGATSDGGGLPNTENIL